jgi:hypothetical protein
VQARHEKRLRHSWPAGMQNLPGSLAYV